MFKRGQRVEILSRPHLGLDKKLIGRCGTITKTRALAPNGYWVKLDGPKATRVWLAGTEIEVTAKCRWRRGK